MVDNKYKIVLSKKFRDQIKIIVEYYEREGGKQTSKKARQSILLSIKSLMFFPKRKPKLELPNPLPYEVRITKVWSYKIIYRVIEERKEVRILTVRHDKESPDKLEKDLK